MMSEEQDDRSGRQPKKAGAVARARWGMRKGQPIGLFHLTNAISVGNIAQATRLLDQLAAWGRQHGLSLSDAEEILRDVEEGRGREAARAFTLEYDRSPDREDAPEIGRPAEIRGKRRSLYLDEATVKAAQAIGEGNLSEGVRRAVEAFKSTDEGGGRGEE